MAEELKRKLLQKIHLPELIGQFVQLQKSSGNFRGCCPFHNENTPSFYVYSDHFHCFGCRAHGDAIEFVRKTQGLGFIDTLKWLGGKFGVDTSELDKNRNDDERKIAIRRTKVLLTAQDFFVKNLWENSGDSARKYLLERGFTEETLKHYGFGLANNHSYELIKHLRSLGFTPDEMGQASLATFYEKDNRWYDFFKNRVTIPIRDGQGRLIAFGGRALDDSPQKYKNSRYDKGNVLFGLSEARSEIKAKSRAIVVEGYLDAIQMWQFGFRETVASQGTALTLSHLKQLAHTTGVLYLLFDGDGAGQRATMRVLTEAMNVPNLTLKVVTLPNELDPDEFLLEQGAEKLEELLRESTDLVQYAILQKIEGASPTALPDIVSKELLPWVKNTSDPVRRAFLLARIAQLSGIREAVLTDLLMTDRPKSEKPDLRVKPLKIEGPYTPAGSEKEILAHLHFAEPGQLELDPLIDFLTNEMRLNEVSLSLASDFIEILRSGNSPSKTDLSAIDSAHDTSVAAFLVSLRQKHELYQVPSRSKAIQTLLSSYRANVLKTAVQNLKAQIGRVSADDQSQILREIQSIQNELFGIERELRNPR